MNVSDRVLELAQACGSDLGAASEAAELIMEGTRVLAAARGALLAAEHLAEARLPWSQLVPVVAAGVPELLRTLGPVHVQPARCEFNMPVWLVPSGPETWRLTRIRQTLEIAARLTPGVVWRSMRQADHICWGSGIGPEIAWAQGEDPDGVNSLSRMYRTLTERPYDP